MRKTPLIPGEYYHVYNRGTDKRAVFMDQYDLGRFLKSMEEFNTINPIGSIYQNRFNKQKPKNKKLVNFIAFCLNPNHYHFILTPRVLNGIERFMQRLGNGYTKYFNNKYKRSGVLFQGAFKSIHIHSNEYLLHASVYVNLNFKVHSLGHSMSKSSWEVYVGEGNIKNKGFCCNDVIMDQFKTKRAYKIFAERSIEDILMRKKSQKEMEDMVLKFEGDLDIECPS